MASSPGTRVGPYEIGALPVSGGMGEVYLEGAPLGSPVPIESAIRLMSHVQ